MPVPDLISKFLGNFVSSGLKGAAGAHLEENGTPCGIKDCEMFSVGLNCNSCGRPLCISHVYLKPNIKRMRPEPICPSCIVDNHPELFE